MPLKYQMILFFALCVFPVFAQTIDQAQAIDEIIDQTIDQIIEDTEDTENSIDDDIVYIEDIKERPRFVQRISWTGGEYALRYEVIIQRHIEDEYMDFSVESTDELFVEVSLPPGEYRIMVITYNVLDKPEGSTEWNNITVLPALIQEESDIIAEEESAKKSKKPYKPLGFMMSAGWAPVIPLYETTLGKKNISNMSAVLRVSKIFYIPFDFYLGPEFNALAYMVNTENDKDELMLAPGLNILCHKKMTGERTAINFRIGVDYVLDSENNEININMGMSLYMRLFKHMYLEAGADFSNLFGNEEVYSGRIRPWIGIGIQF